MKLDTPGKRVIFLRSLSGLTRKEFEEKYGIPAITLRSWETAMRIKSKAAKRLFVAIQQEGIRCCIDWIISGNGSPPSIGGSLSVSSEELNLLGSSFDEDISGEILFLQKKYKNAFTAILINDDANLPLLSTGDYVGGVLSRNVKEFIKQLCIVENDNGIVLVRQLIASKDHDKYHLRAYNRNKAFPTLYNQKIKNVWKIIWIRKRP